MVAAIVHLTAATASGVAGAMMVAAIVHLTAATASGVAGATMAVVEEAAVARSAADSLRASASASPSLN
eukprot:2554877-Prymnesium_polylepis.1